MFVIILHDNIESYEYWFSIFTNLKKLYGTHVTNTIIDLWT